jgi:hypothetical protein
MLDLMFQLSDAIHANFNTLHYWKVNLFSTGQILKYEDRPAAPHQHDPINADKLKTKMYYITEITEMTRKPSAASWNTNSLM